MYLHTMMLLVVSDFVTACPMRAQYGNMNQPGYNPGCPMAQAAMVPGRLVNIHPKRQRDTHNVHRERRRRYGQQAFESQALVRQVRAEQRSYAGRDPRNRDDVVKKPVPETRNARQTLIGKTANLLESSKDMIHNGVDRLSQAASDPKSGTRGNKKESKVAEDEKSRLQQVYDDKFRQREAEIQKREPTMHDKNPQLVASGNVIPRIPITSAAAVSQPARAIQFVPPQQIQAQPPTQYIVIPRQEVVPEKQTTRTIVVEEYILPGHSLMAANTNPETITSAYQITSAV